MRTIGYLIQKEFIQIFRNRTLLPIMFIAPIVQMLVLVFAANMNMKDIDFCVYDGDGSLTSTRLISKFEGSPFFKTPGHPVSSIVANEMLRTGKVDILINIPSGFERELSSRGSSDIQLLVDGINSGSAVLISAYAQNILKEFNNDIKGVRGILNVGQIAKKVDIGYNHWYNPELDFKIFMVPGILVVLVTMVGWILAAFNIVREKEIGTIEQINVTPIKKYQFIVGKLVPFWLIAMFELALGLFIGKLIFDIPFLGSIFLLFSFAGLYLVVALSIGLFISTISHNQQQVMFVSFFFMLTFILMSGLFTPVESMPKWAEIFNYFNPIAYFVRVIRMIILKGSEFSHVYMEFVRIGIFGLVMLSLATWTYRKRT